MRAPVAGVGMREQGVRTGKAPKVRWKMEVRRRLLRWGARRKLL